MLIDKQKTYEVLTDYYHHSTQQQHMALREALEQVPEATPDCNGDSISREDAIGAVKALVKDSEEGWHFKQYVPADDVMSMLDKLPSVQEIRNLEDGTLVVTIPNCMWVTKVLVKVGNTQNCTMFCPAEGDDK